MIYIFYDYFLSQLLASKLIERIIFFSDTMFLFLAFSFYCLYSFYISSEIFHLFHLCCLTFLLAPLTYYS